MNPTLSIDEIRKFKFNFLTDQIDSSDLSYCDPESNSLCNMILTDSDYITEKYSNAAHTPSDSSGILFYNINSIPHNLENFLANSDSIIYAINKFLNIL